MRVHRPTLARFFAAFVLSVPLAVALPAAAVAAPQQGHVDVECADGSTARVPKWATDLKEPGQVGPEKAAEITQKVGPGVAAAERDSAVGRLHPGLVNVPTWVHVISYDETVAGGNVPRRWIRDQMRVLNQSFSGATDSVPTAFRFRLEGVTRTVNPVWADMEPETEVELEAKTALRQGGPETLNIYVTPSAGGFLGWAYLPDGVVEFTPWDGVVILAGSMPGGDVEPYNEGDTATHEVGHWLSLLHTFENGCTYPGDDVRDTPYEAEPAFGCPLGRDTCAQPGNDPVENFMDYSDDPCMHEFTWGQSFRMLGAWYVFRA